MKNKSPNGLKNNHDSGKENHSPFESGRKILRFAMTIRMLVICGLSRKANDKKSHKGCNHVHNTFKGI
ncbi:hypothetical protein D3C87_2121770 [compost metagenome]